MSNTQKKELKKVIRDGKVAVLYSPRYGAGWLSWNTSVPECVFSPEIVKLVEENNRNEITDELCTELFGVDYFYSGGARDLQIEWLDEGTAFRITEYDGFESIEIIAEIDYLTA